MPKDCPSPNWSDTTNRISLQLEHVVRFLRSISLELHFEENASGFIDGVRIDQGRLFVAYDCRPSSLLHEASHICCVPRRYRHLMSGNLADGIRKMFEDLERLDLDPDHPLVRAAIQCSDPEATALSWAMGKAIGLAPEEVIMDEEYDGGGAEIRMMLEANQYVGINGLAHAGMCKRGRMLAPALCYPTMTYWLQPADIN